MDQRLQVADELKNMFINDLIDPDFRRYTQRAAAGLAAAAQRTATFRDEAGRFKLSDATTWRTFLKTLRTEKDEKGNVQLLSEGPRAAIRTAWMLAFTDGERSRGSQPAWLSWRGVWRNGYGSRTADGGEVRWRAQLDAAIEAVGQRQEEAEEADEEEEAEEADEEEEADAFDAFEQ